jgi:redox-sensitive bicupin YhaK (pirin superfamily)
MIQIRHSHERGSGEHGWLRSRHSFSFAGYYDPDHMGVSALRVINDDRVAPGAGFATHSHQDMEIISYVQKGTIEHKDSMGHVETLPAGEFQLMSAGSGVTHSEYNPSSAEPLEFLQIWIEPNVTGIEPGYQQKRFDAVEGLQLIASPDARKGSLLMHQDACLYQLRLRAGQSASHSLEPGRTAYVHLISGSLRLNGEHLGEGDGATVKADDRLELTGDENSEALVFDLP